MFQDFGATYVEQGRIATPDDLATVDDVCRIKGRAGVGLLTDRPVERTRIGLPGLSEDVDSGRWVEADAHPAGVRNHRGVRVRARGR